MCVTWCNSNKFMDAELSSYEVLQIIQWNQDEK